MEDAVREASRECLLNRLCEFFGTEHTFNSDLQKETILHGKVELIKWLEGITCMRCGFPIAYKASWFPVCVLAEIYAKRQVRAFTSNFVME